MTYRTGDPLVSPHSCADFFFDKTDRKGYIIIIMKVNAYIDAANLHKGVATLGWKLDYSRFRIWLKDKYQVENAYLFIGLIPKLKDLYTFLQEVGYTVAYKEVSYDGTGKVKGNCDAELVLKVASDYYEKRFDQAILVSSDGDYAGLVKFLRDRKVFRILISPNKNCSFLLRKLNVPIVYLDSQRRKLELGPNQKEKAPGRD